MMRTMRTGARQKGKTKEIIQVRGGKGTDSLLPSYDRGLL